MVKENTPELLVLEITCRKSDSTSESTNHAGGITNEIVYQSRCTRIALIISPWLIVINSDYQDNGTRNLNECTGNANAHFYSKGAKDCFEPLSKYTQIWLTSFESHNGHALSVPNQEQLDAFGCNMKSVGLSVQEQKAVDSAKLQINQMPAA